MHGTSCTTSITVDRLSTLSFVHISLTNRFGSVLLLSVLLILFLLLFLLLLQWRYSPTWALVSSVLRLQTSLSSANLLQFLHFNILLAPLSTAFIHLPLGLPNGLISSIYHLKAILGTLSSFILITWPTHWSVLSLTFVVVSISLFKL
jgi:hypothetical protein